MDNKIKREIILSNDALTSFCIKLQIKQTKTKYCYWYKK